MTITELYDLAVGPAPPHKGPQRRSEWQVDDYDIVADDWPQPRPRHEVDPQPSTDG